MIIIKKVLLQAKLHLDNADASGSSSVLLKTTDRGYFMYTGGEEKS